MSDKASTIKEAQKYLAKGQIDKAIAEWEKLIKELPDANSCNTVGDLYLKKGDKNSAIAAFSKAARFFRDDGFSVKALALYKKILNINPSNTDSLFALGELSEEKGLVTDAIKYYLATADILAKEGKKEALLRTYDKILGLSPSNISLRNKVAELFIKEGLHIEASKEYLHIARVYEDKDDINNAKTYLKKALDLQPNNKDALLCMSSLLARAGDQKQSVEFIKKAESLFPEDSEISLKYAQILIDNDAFAEAIQRVNKIVAAEPSNITAKKLLGDIYLKQGDMHRAWQEYSAVIDDMVFGGKVDEAIDTLAKFTDIELVEARKKLISLYKQKGDIDSAFNELVFLGDNFVIAESGKLTEAINCYQEALQLHPDDASLKNKIADLERELGGSKPGEKPAKTFEESLVESEIFVRYGLYDEAKTLLEGLKVQRPENIDVHTKLKDLYVSIGDKENAVSECLALAEIYGKSEDLEHKEMLLKEAYIINPNDPRLLEKAPVHHPSEETPDISKISEDFGKKTGSIDDYSEELAEAEFYLRQGLAEDARAIYERLLNLFPDNDEIKEKMNSIGLESSVAEELVDEQSAEEAIQSSAEKFIVKSDEDQTFEPEPSVVSPAETFLASETMEAQEVSEPTLENDVLDIFEEFKKGLEKELGEEDSETHYNLGIAYKEMGLLDDAIREFQLCKNDPKRIIQSDSMLGLCYMSKGMFPLAIESFSNALGKIDVRDESYWGVKYDLAEANEKNGDIKQAIEIYTEIYGWNAKFRKVAEKINLLKSMGDVSEEKPDAVAKKPKAKRERVSYL